MISAKVTVGGETGGSSLPACGGTPPAGEKQTYLARIRLLRAS